MENNNINQEEIVKLGDSVVVDITELNSKNIKRNIFQIVESYEYNPKDEITKVDIISPLGKKLIFGKIGDNGDYKVHEYKYHYEIIDIIKKRNENFMPKTKSLKK